MTLKDRTDMKVKDVMMLLEFTLTTTYFLFDGQIFQQKFGTAMGSPVSPIVVNLYMEWLEQEAVAVISMGKIVSTFTAINQINVALTR